MNGCMKQESTQFLAENSELTFPSPFAIAIDDMGWMGGGSLKAVNGPSRLGIKRDLTASDYQAVIDIAKGAGIRLQGLFILCELDRANVCATVPTSTQYGSQWDNSRYIGEEQIRIMDLVKSNAAYLEFGLHGVGHEFWQDGIMHRAEWYNTDKNHPWDERDIRNHLELFKEIMAQYGLTRENGHSFPESFVPCAYSYYWNPSAEPYSLGKLLNAEGVRFANTLFSYITELNPPEAKSGGFDNGVLVIDRYNHGNPWYEPASLPRDAIDDFQTDMIETHFANLLATDDFLQPALNEKWISFFKEVQANPGKYLAKNTEQFYSQWILKRYVKTEKLEPYKLQIDTRNIPDWAYENGFITNMVLKAPLLPNEVISKATVNGKEIPACFIDEGYAMLYLPYLESGVHVFEMEKGAQWQEGLVMHDGTYNVYGSRITSSQLIFDLRVYGEQTIRVATSHIPKSIESSNSNMTVKYLDYDSDKMVLTFLITARDIQGETGTITVDLH